MLIHFNCPNHGSIASKTVSQVSRSGSDTCFRYWNVVGTDCGRCMAVCPYSHPDNPAHNLVRWTLRRSGIARRGALWMDDIFYGANPAPRPAPDWLPRRIEY